MSHKSFRSITSDAPLEVEPSVQQRDPDSDEQHVNMDQVLDDLEAEDEPQVKVQGFFGVRPWSIKLAPSKPKPLSTKEPIEVVPENRWLQTTGNVIWVGLFGWWFSLLHLILALIMFITIVGIPYGKLCITMAKYWIWPFGKFIVERVKGFHEGSTLLSEENPFPTHNRRNAADDAYWASHPVTPKMSPGYFVWVFFASIILTPISLLCTAISWFFVLPIPMSKTHWNLIKIIYTKPLDIKIESEYGSAAQSYSVVLCTYQAFSTRYVKYTFMGLNIFLVNLFPVLIAVVVAASAIPHGKGLPDPAQFVVYLICCIPITFYIGMAISCIAAQTNYMIGALLNASFGSMTELILYGSAIRKGGLDELVKYSVTGGLLSDMLLLPGLSMIAGGIKYKDQKFNPVAAGASSLLLFIAVVGIFTPTVWYQVYGAYNQSCNQCQLVVLPVNSTAPVAPPTGAPGAPVASPAQVVQNVTQILCNSCYTTPVNDLDLDPRYHSHARYLIYFCAAILPVSYIVGLVFTFFTHSHIFQQEEHGEEEDLPTWGLPFAVVFMMINTVMFGLLAEHIVDVVKPTLDAFGLPQSFLGLTLIALVPATTEIVNAIKFALVNQISLSVEIGSASAVQISLIQIPFLVALSAIVNGSKTLHSFVLIFPLLTVFAVILSVITFNYISAEGRTSYFTGASLVVIYAVFVASFYFIPQTTAPGSPSKGHNVVMSMMNLG